MVLVSVITVVERQAVCSKLVSDLRSSNPGARIRVVTGDRVLKSVWATARNAWWWGLAEGPEFTHHCVLQDDVIVCRDFVATLERLVTYLPDALIVPYLGATGREPFAKARQRGVHWLYGGSLSGQAVLLPQHRARELLAWTDRYVRPEYPWDDQLYSAWCETWTETWWHTAPSLVQHGYVRSTFGHPSGERARSPWFAGVETSGLSYDWSLGLDQPVRNIRHLSMREWQRLLRPGLTREQATLPLGVGMLQGKSR